MALWNRQNLGRAGYIADLTPSVLEPLSIKVLATFKSTMSHVPYYGGDRRFYVILKDETGQIQATAFQDTHHFHDHIQENEVYLFTGLVGSANIAAGFVKDSHPSNKTCNPYEIIFRPETIIGRINDESFKELVNAIPETIGDVNDYEPISGITAATTYANVLAICVEVSEIMEMPYTYDNSRILSKRNIILQDHSGRINLSLWGRYALEHNFDGHPVVCVRGAVVGEYEENLELDTEMVLVNPPGPAVEELREWWAGQL